MFEEKDDTIMARWLSGGLSPEEEEAFRDSSEYAEYKAMITAMDRFEKPFFDQAALKGKVLERIERRTTAKVIPLRRLTYIIGIAASVLLIFGVFFSKTTYRSGIGEKLTVLLPDGSQVAFNAGSTLTHRRFFWQGDKTVSLVGEALFTIEKGDRFEVMTNFGKISVLGTRFNVRSRSLAKTLEVRCYEGKVLCQDKEAVKKYHLEAGEGVAASESEWQEFQHKANGPSWKAGTSTFTNAPLTEVLDEIARQYPISFKGPGKDHKGHFTGTFVHHDLELALKTVLVPMGVSYELSDDKSTITLNIQ